MKSWMIIALCICLAVSVTACSQRGNTNEPVTSSQSQSASENPSTPSEQEQGEQNTPAFVEDDAFYQNILLTYGGEMATDEAGKSYLRVTQGASLFNKSGWYIPQELDALDYYLWYMTMMWQEDISIEAQQEKYKSPFGEDTGWFFPQNLFEPLVQKYFDVSVEHLRSNTNVYNEEYKGYSIGGGGGFGESPPIILEKVESDGNLRRLHVRLDYEYQEAQNSRILTVRLDPDGSYKFESYTIAGLETVQVSFAAPVVNEMGTILTETVGFSIYLPGNWTVADLEISDDGRKVAEVLPSRIVYNKSNPFEDTDFLFGNKAVTVRDITAGLYPGKYYHMQTDMAAEGLTVINNELIYCLNIGDRMILIAFYPAYGIGIGTQNEQFSSFLDTIKLL